MKAWQQTLLLGAGFGVAFLLGQTMPNLLSAQGRGPVNAPPVPTPGTEPPPSAEPPLVYAEEGGHAASANGFVAVTGSYGVGTSVLYLIDTNSRQLAVYEARGGDCFPQEALVNPSCLRNEVRPIPQAMIIKGGAIVRVGIDGGEADGSRRALMGASIGHMHPETGSAAVGFRCVYSR